MVDSHWLSTLVEIPLPEVLGVKTWSASTVRIEPLKDKLASAVKVPSPSDVNTLFAASLAITSVRSKVNPVAVESKPLDRVISVKSRVTLGVVVPLVTSKPVPTVTSVTVPDQPGRS